MVSVMPTVSRNSGQGHVLNAYLAPAFCCTSLVSHTPPMALERKLNTCFIGRKPRLGEIWNNLSKVTQLLISGKARV